MKKKQRRSRYVLSVGLFLVCLLLLIKYFNLTWVEVSASQAKVTVNFLIPMDQKRFDKALLIESERSDCGQFSYQLNWLSPQAVEITLQEQNAIKGLKIKLLIHDAPTQIKGLTKSERISIPFHVPITVKEEGSRTLISSTEAFVIHFNTPIHTKDIEQYMTCGAPFYVSPYQNEALGKKSIDPACFVLVPKKPLENGKCYTLTIKPGLRALSGSILAQEIKMYLQVDEKPVIIETYPMAGDKWIGLYPKITFTSKSPIVAAIAKVNDETIQAVLIDERHGYFLLQKPLQPMTEYPLQIQSKAASGELSAVKKISFTTTSLNNKRGWLDIRCGKEKCIQYYEGTEKVRSFVCGIGREIQSVYYGTYYLMGKGEVYENDKQQEGANYWMPLNESIGIHGYTRNSKWEIQQNKVQDIGGRTLGKNIILSDEDAKWLYDKVTDQTMVILRD